MHAFIHGFKHGISAISNHPVPLLSMKELFSRHQSQKERWGVRRAHHSRQSPSWSARHLDDRSVGDWRLSAKASVA
ncbi:hypothetical protein SB758_32725, partial [Burkholderia sp. SIMBA_013]